MGGTGGETDKANPAVSPTTFAGSRAAVSNAAAPSWAGVMSETSPAVDPAYAKLSASPLAVNPDSGSHSGSHTGDVGLHHTPYSTGALPHIGAPEPRLLRRRKRRRSLPRRLLSGLSTRRPRRRLKN